MVKIIYCIRRRADLSPGEFQQYWKQVHAPLLMNHRHTLRLSGYVQTSPLKHEYSDRVERRQILDAPFDGVAELYWANSEDMSHAFDSAEARLVQKMLADDEKNFIDHARSTRWIANEISPILPNSIQ